jgi:hypothetical protein
MEQMRSRQVRGEERNMEQRSSRHCLLGWLPEMREIWSGGQGEHGQGLNLIQGLFLAYLLLFDTVAFGIGTGNGPIVLIGGEQSEHTSADKNGGSCGSMNNFNVPEMKKPSIPEEEKNILS